MPAPLMEGHVSEQSFVRTMISKRAHMTATLRSFMVYELRFEDARKCCVVDDVLNGLSVRDI